MKVTELHIHMVLSIVLMVVMMVRTFQSVTETRVCDLCHEKVTKQLITTTWMNFAVQGGF